MTRAKPKPGRPGTLTPQQTRPATQLDHLRVGPLTADERAKFTGPQTAPPTDSPLQADASAEAAMPAKQTPAATAATGTVPPAGLLGTKRTASAARLRWVLPAVMLALSAAAMLCLYYGLGNAHGLLLGAVALMVCAAFRAKRATEYVFPGMVAGLLVIYALVIDRESRSLFALLPSLERDATPVSPLILLVLAALAAWLLAPRGNARSRRSFGRLFLRGGLTALVLALLALTLYDAFQNSLLSLLLVWLAVRWVGARRRDRRLSLRAVLNRLRAAANGRLALQLLMLIAFAFANGWQSTHAVLIGLQPLLWAIVPPLLLLASLAVSLLPVGLLYIVLYPILPGRFAFLKAIALAIFLLLVFLLGIGADARLAYATPALFVGRLVYYLSVPLLIGLSGVLPGEGAAARPAPAPAKPTPPPPTDSAQAKPTAPPSSADLLAALRKYAAPLATLAALVAPGLYASIANAPLLVGYFNLLAALLDVAP